MDPKKPSVPAKKNAENVKPALVIPSIAPSDFAFIRKALIALGLSIVFSAALIGGSRMILLKLRDTGNQLQVQRDEARNRYTQAETEKEEIRDYQPRFLQLRARGFFGEEKRLDLIEHIRHIYDNRKLLPLNYEIAAQQAFQLEPSVLTADLELRSSKIKLQMNLLHEMDLFNFLEDLKSKAFYTTQSCVISRVESLFNNPLAPHLTAECTLYWLSIGEPTQNDPSKVSAK